ncbi:MULTISPECIES: hypothetical protein [unclassified Bradyrhizobium]|uniref:hypothetical protein n=1 Tax=unclassified Bradyrhizobium TaxID=2631580 RepID=UPI0011613B08|nr:MULTISPECIES: hypothetical protein [unclassified Bradyrhizobium]
MFAAAVGAGAHTAPVSRQKQPNRNTTNANEIIKNFRKINEPNHYPIAHNGLVAGLIQAKLATRSIAGHSLLVRVPDSRPSICHVPKSWM